jgi:hypothetical protein
VHCSNVGSLLPWLQSHLKPSKLQCRMPTLQHARLHSRIAHGVPFCTCRQAVTSSVNHKQQGAFCHSCWQICDMCLCALSSA